jgi:hypothetical protein
MAEDSDCSQFSDDSSSDDESNNGDESKEPIVCSQCTKSFDPQKDRGCDVDSDTCSKCFKAQMKQALADLGPDGCTGSGTVNKADLPKEGSTDAPVENDVEDDDGTADVERDGTESGSKTDTPNDGYTGVTLDNGVEKNDPVDPVLPAPVIPITNHALIHNEDRRQSILHSFMSEEVSMEISIAGNNRTVCRKKFRMDKEGGVVWLWVDLVVMDKIPLLYNYFVLAGHANINLKRVSYSMVVIRHTSGKKYILLCILRTKCPKPRYDAVIYDHSSLDQDNAVWRVPGLTELFKHYEFLPDEAIDFPMALDELKKFVEREDDRGNSLVWKKTQPNKDEMGRLMSKGYEPDSDGSAGTALGKRNGTKAKTYAESYEKPPGKAKKKRTRAANKKKEIVVLTEVI